MISNEYFITYLEMILVNYVCVLDIYSELII